jgi:hypothetical protein
MKMGRDWPVNSLGRYLALGEFILEATESAEPHDSWLMAAREAYLKWKQEQNIDTSSPAKANGYTVDVPQL